MKKTKITKALILALSLVLLVGSAIGISVAAAEETTATGSTATMPAVTVVHDDKIQIAFAIDATTDEVKAGTAYIEYYFDGDTANTKKAALYTGATDQNETVLVTEGLAAQDLTSVVTATSYLNGAAVETKTYSVAQFLLTKLYRDIDEVDANYAALYESLIDYSAKAQAVFDPDETSINDWFYVSFDNATYNGKDFLVSDKAITLEFANVTAATVANYSFNDKWYATVDGTAAPYATDATLEVSSNTVVSPALEINAGTGKYFNDTTKHSTAVVLDFAEESDVTDYMYYDYVNTSGTAFDLVGSRTLNEETGDYEFVSNCTTNWQGFAIKSPDSTKVYSSGIYVFEADITFTGLTTYKSDGNMFIGFVSADSTMVQNADMFEMGWVTFDSATPTEVTFFESGGSGTVKLDVGVRYNLRLEYNITTGKTGIYVNGELIKTISADSSTGTNSTGVVTDNKGLTNNKLGSFGFVNRRSTHLTIDNIYYGVVDGVEAAAE